MDQCELIWIALREELHLKPYLSSFVRHLKTINPISKKNASNISILKQIGSETQQLHWNSLDPLVLDRNTQNTNYFKYFLIFYFSQKICLKILVFFVIVLYWLFWDGTQNFSNFTWGTKNASYFLNLWLIIACTTCHVKSMIHILIFGGLNLNSTFIPYMR